MSTSQIQTSPQQPFSVVRKGYDRGEVTRYLLEIGSTLDAGSAVNPAEVRDRFFTVTKRGYDRPSVHRHLDNLATAIEDNTVSPLELAA